MSAKYKRSWVLSAISLLVAWPLSAELRVEDAWIAANPPGTRVAAMYLSLSNTDDKAINVNGIEVDGVPRVMIHQTTNVDGQMRMRHQDNLWLEPGETIIMSPGGLHVMLMGSKQFIKDEVVSFRVNLDDQRQVTASAIVKEM